MVKLKSPTQKTLPRVIEGITLGAMLRVHGGLWICLLSMAANVLLVLFIQQRSAKFEINPFFIEEYERSQDLFEVLPLNLWQENFQAQIMERLVREYTVERLTLINDVGEINRRFNVLSRVNKLRRMSSPDIWADIAKVAKEPEKRLISATSKEIAILKVIHHGTDRQINRQTNDSRWELELREYTLNMNQDEPVVRDFRVKITASLDIYDSRGLRLGLFDYNKALPPDTQLEPSYLFRFQVKQWAESE